MIGRTVGHYRILERLGGGGMGVVYKAEDLALGRFVALKFLPPELTRDPEAKSRFLREARAASLLDHTNICTIHEIGETSDEQTFIAMACYDGETLATKIERGATEIDDALRLAAQVARGLRKAHDSGIVHRDIKPANVIVTNEGVAKILDFGLAKLAGATHITQSKTTLGTLAYMAPEQIRGEAVGPQVDLWALGVVLFELLTGQRPFRGEYAQAVAYSILNEQPASLKELKPDAPPELERIVKKLLRKDPLQRCQTADEVLAELETLRVPNLGSAKSGARAARPRECLRSGARLGPYEIVELLGSGGMGDVYRARDTRLDRQVAIKVLARAVSEDVALRERFRREAKTISSLSHPNICTLFDVGEQEGTDFLVMEHLAGETLADRLARGALAVPELLEIGIQIGDALAAAHRQGVVHRDLKPANVMLTATGGVKLLDFGLAKGIASVLEAIDSGGGVDSPRPDDPPERRSNESSAPAAASPSPETPARPLTSEGVIVGTLPYMSPEQVEGREADARSDIFALGAILYEMATGRRAFRGDTKARLLAAILEREPKALAESGAPSASALQAVVSRCLEKDPEKRFAAATDVTDQLRRLAASGEMELSAVGRLTRLPARWMAAHAAAVSVIVSLLVVTGVVFGILEWRREHADAAPGTATATPAPAAIGPKLEPRRVVVAVFENRTGDGSLDRVGQMAADWIIDALVPTGTDVVAAAVSSVPAAKTDGRDHAGPDADQAVVLAEAAKAGLLVTGETYLSGDSIRLHAKVIDVATRKLLYAIDPAEAPRANPDGAVEAVSARARDAVTHAIRIRETDPIARWNDRSMLSELRPPRYEAVVELRLAREARNRQNSTEQCARSARAVELDSEFVTALSSLMDCHFIRGEFSEAEASREKVWALRSRLTPAGSLHLEGYIAMMDGRHERAVVVQREAVKLEPREPAMRHQLARYLIHANRPGEAITVLDS
ncbi:MAG: serine/threonine protein kinase, partial [Thermoanaerobaculia bacterium]|nr:serine/threonine protein kinase [Thermoanaerobaculia bacterium]